MDELTTKEGQLITKGREICTIATAHFKEWHSMKPTATFGFHDPHCDHNQLLNDETYFIQQHTCTGVPLALLSTLWKSLQAPIARFGSRLPTNSTLQQDIDSISATPSFNEFTTTLRSMPTKSAAGPSGLTYNMIASLPPDHLLALYKHMVTLWDKRASLPAWKWRELSPLPKVWKTSLSMTSVLSLSSKRHGKYGSAL
jgi:hypothetical protein